MAADIRSSRVPARVRWHVAAFSLTLVVLAVSALARGFVAPASAQTPILVTNPDGSVSYVTPQYGSALVNSPSGGSYYVPGNGGPVLVTNPNGTQSYANVNGAPSLVTGPDGSVSYQYVVVGTTGLGGSTLAYVNPNGGSGPLVSTAQPAGQSLGGQPLTIGRQAPIPARGARLSGRYCDLPDGGQVWVADGAPADGASC